MKWFNKPIPEQGDTWWSKFKYEWYWTIRNIYFDIMLINLVIFLVTITFIGKTWWVGFNLAFIGFFATCWGLDESYCWGGDYDG